MKAWLWKYKWYVLHGAAVAAAFLDPSVKAFLGSHHDTSGIGILLWGWLLHRLEGK